MELQEITKENISRTTGRSILELLQKKPIVDARLKKLQRRRRPMGTDLLVRGNPQLTLGNITTIEDVNAYFDKKKEARRENA